MNKDIEHIYRIIGARVAQIRKDLNYSQEKLAELSGLDRSHIGYIEQGRRKPTLSTLLKIAEALGVSLQELMEGV